MNRPTPGERGFGDWGLFPFPLLNSLRSAVRLARSGIRSPPRRYTVFPPNSGDNPRKKHVNQKAHKRARNPKKGPAFLGFFPKAPYAPEKKLSKKLPPPQHPKGGQKPPHRWFL
eukprot:FR735526.1.p1 GENE.FR735526.1~~FR735526.1.p1  ORF type:complete len:114 (+),score=31.29 FR735526.1:785-1126(+)